MGRLLVSVRGPNEALAAAEGRAHIADVEYPASALGTQFPLNIRAVRQRLDEAGSQEMLIFTNEVLDQPVRSSACQAALCVALAGADFIKLRLRQTQSQGRGIPRQLPCSHQSRVVSREEVLAAYVP